MLSRLFSRRTARALGLPVPRGLVLDAHTLDIETGDELGSTRLDVPRAGGWLLAHDRVWVRAWRPPSESHGHQAGS